MQQQTLEQKGLYTIGEYLKLNDEISLLAIAVIRLDETDPDRDLVLEQAAKVWAKGEELPEGKLAEFAQTYLLELLVENPIIALQALADDEEPTFDPQKLREVVQQELLNLDDDKYILELLLLFQLEQYLNIFISGMEFQQRLSTAQQPETDI